MDIFANFESWGLASKIYFGIALFSTLVLLIQLFLSIFGFGDGADFDTDVDLGVDASAHHGLSGIGGITYFSVSSITAFLSFFGWVGFFFARDGLWAIPTFFLSFIAGLVALLAVAFLLHFVQGMASSGNVKIDDAIGELGTVYLKIPKGKNQSGAVNVNVHETLKEYRAVSEDGHEISTGTRVKVTGTMDSRTLIVKPVESPADWMEKGL